MGDLHPGVDAYIDNLPGWQADLCRELRTVVHAADPDVDETIKRSVRPYFVLQGNVCALLANKDHINLFIYDPHAPDPDKIINQGQDNATARAIQIYQGDVINRAALIAMLHAVIARNRAGGWRRLDAQWARAHHRPRVSVPTTRRQGLTCASDRSR
jgi:hypothetical protein